MFLPCILDPRILAVLKTLRYLQIFFFFSLFNYSQRKVWSDTASQLVCSSLTVYFPHITYNSLHERIGKDSDLGSRITF